MIRCSLYTLLFIMCSFWCQPAIAQYDSTEVVTGAEQMDTYLPMLQGKNVGLVINRLSMIDYVLLPDTFLGRGVKVKKIYAPEHGFRGSAEAGEKVDNETDKKTGLPIISLYGKNKKPTKKDLKNIDVMVFDIQDVGVRFYTYISTLQYVMEACAENDIPLIVLDRPNPNGHYVDGPVLDTSLRSFVGMQPIPIVHGLTVGEYAKMLIGERWFPGAEKLDLQVIPCQNYDHKTMYRLLLPPSPNLKNMTAIYLYPSLCLFEGTVVSVARGTDKPFMQWGHPLFKGKAAYSFEPVTVWGSNVKPPYAFEECFGQIAASNEQEAQYMIANRVQLFWLRRAYGWYPDKDKFFNNFFENLAGTRELRKQIQKGTKDAEIYASWQPGLNAYKQIRKKYLLYKDFE